MGTETNRLDTKFCLTVEEAVKLNNPLMGTETNLQK